MDDVMSVFEKQMMVIDPSMRPQGKTKMRLKSFMDQRKLPAAHYNYLKAYWAKPGISYEYSAFMGSHFDFVGFWVGECALDTLMPYWRTAAVVSESSQFTHMLWAEATFEQGERMSADSMVQHCCVAATIHHFCDIGLERKVLHEPTVDNFIKGLRAAPAGGASQETLCVVSELADITPEDESQYALTITRACVDPIPLDRLRAVCTYCA